MKLNFFTIIHLQILANTVPIKLITLFYLNGILIKWPKPSFGHDHSINKEDKEPIKNIKEHQNTTEVIHIHDNGSEHKH